MTERRKRESEEGVKSLVKVIQILDCFSTRDRALPLAELCRRTGFPKSTAHRLLASMRDVGLIDQDQERDRYRLGLRLFQYGNIALSNLDLHREARVFVDNLRRISTQTVHLAVFDGFQAVVIHKADPSPETTTPLNLLENAPVHCTGIGKAILAFQDEEAIERLIETGLRSYTEATLTEASALREELRKIREAGYAVDNGEHQPGLRCVAAPIRDQVGRVFASISISGPAWQLSEEKERELSQIAIYHANMITERLLHA